MTDNKKTKTSNSTKNGNINPFARALAETEKPLSDRPGSSLSKDQNSLFSQALSNSGGKLDQQMSPDELQKQQEEAEKLRKKEILRRKLHREVNPVDMVDVFSQREKRVKQEIDQIRHELRLLLPEIHKLDLEIAVMQDVTSPGLEGSYHITFFQQLKSLIMLLRQRVRSARTWAKQMNAKASKKKRRGKFSAGIDMSGKGAEQSAAVFDTMHHERSTAYSGA